MKIKILIVLFSFSTTLTAQFSENATHIYPTDTDQKLMFGTDNPGNSDGYKIFIDLRDHFTALGDDHLGIKFKTGNWALEFDNSATSIDPTYDHPVIKPSGDLVGFLGKPNHRWFEIYAATINANEILPNQHLCDDIGSTDMQWKRVWSEVIRAKNYFPYTHNTGQIGGADFSYKELFVTDVNCVTLTASSDARLKSNFRPILQPLSKIKALKGWKYDYHVPQTEVTKTDKLGFVAQELQEVLPELVQKNETTEKYSVDYMGLIPVLVEGMKEQQKMIERQQQEIEELKLMLKKL